MVKEITLGLQYHLTQKIYLGQDWTKINYLVELPEILYNGMLNLLAYTCVRSISNCVLYGSDYERVIGVCCFVFNFYFYSHKKIEQSKR